MLKRKNEDQDTLEETQTKRVAIDAEMLDHQDQQLDRDQTAPLLQKPIYNDTGDESIIPQRSTPISSHKVQGGDDPTYIHLRMLCPVKEAGLIVGKGGEKISSLKDKSGARINVSENIKGIYERVVHVRGPSEKVAKAFGLITRVILDEPETPSAPDAKQYVLKLLIPHPVIGFVIGKGGAKFREIEEHSAAKLKASDQTMSYSTDRCLSITGVPDAIHIATYYVAQTIRENKKQTHNTKIIFYNPGNSNFMMNPSGATGLPQGVPPSFPGAPQFTPNFQFQGFGSPHPQAPPQFTSMMGMMPTPMGHWPSSQPSHNPAMRPLKPYGMNQRNNNGIINKNGGVMDMPASNINHISFASNTIPQGSAPQAPANFPGIPTLPAISQEIYISSDFVGSVIGKGGKNIKEIRDSSGSQIKVQDPETTSPNERKILLIGGAVNNQMATYLINNRIESDRQKNILNGTFQQNSSGNYLNLTSNKTETDV